MYSIEFIHDSLNILWQGHIIVESIKPIISLEDETALCLALIKTDITDGNDILGIFKQHTFWYRDEKDIIKVSLTFKCYEDLLLNYIDLCCKYTTSYNIPVLKCTDGIKLFVKKIHRIDGLLANYLFNGWWTRPYFIKSIEGLPQKTQSLLWNEGSIYHHILPVCDGIYKTELCGSGEGMNIITSAYTGGYNKCNTLTFIMGTMNNPYDLCRKTVSSGLKILNTTGKPREARRYPEIFEYFGWCSWNAFYTDVSSKGLIEKAEDFNNQHIPIKWFMIDNGWFEEKNDKLISFEEDKTKFPEGLKRFVDILKSKYGLKWVGVWHCLSGHWGGIDADSILAKKMKEYLYKTNCDLLIPHPNANKGFVFWNTWHRYLAQQGVDFVKVDDQSALIHNIKNNMAIGTAARESHTGLEASIGINFDNNVINCMGMASEQLWNRPISSVSRNSNDFYPKRKDNFKEHALQNAYNSVYHSNFTWGDWDMWWTDHESAVNNAVLRAVSGGPVYTSDCVGKTKGEILWPLIFDDGRVLRCDQPGMPTLDCLTRNPCEETVPLKIWNKCNCSGIIATFNINLEGKTVEGAVSPSDIPGLNGDKFAVYEYFSGAAHVIDRKEDIDFSLEDNGVKIYVIIPVVNSLALIGLVNKYVSPAAILQQYYNKDKTIVILKEGGVFGFTSEKRLKKVCVNNIEYPFKMSNGLYRIDCTEHRHSICVEIISE